MPSRLHNKEKRLPYLSVSIQPSIGERFKSACAFKDIKPNDILVLAIKNFLKRVEIEMNKKTGVNDE